MFKLENPAYNSFTDTAKRLQNVLDTGELVGTGGAGNDYGKRLVLQAIKLLLKAAPFFPSDQEQPS
jgi:hypothetical protein